MGMHKVEEHFVSHHTSWYDIRTRIKQAKDQGVFSEHDKKPANLMEDDGDLYECEGDVGNGVTDVVKVELCCNDECCPLQPHMGQTWQSISAATSFAYGLTPGTVRCRYIDDDGDTITCDSECELREALLIAHESLLKRLSFHVSGTSSCNDWLGFQIEPNHRSSFLAGRLDVARGHQAAPPGYFSMTKSRHTNDQIPRTHEKEGGEMNLSGSPDSILDVLPTIHNPQQQPPPSGDDIRKEVMHQDPPAVVLAQEAMAQDMREYDPITGEPLFDTPRESEEEGLDVEGQTMSHIIGQIEKDLARTFPTHPAFGHEEALGHHALRRILQRFAALQPGVSYCQGMNFIAALVWLLWRRSQLEESASDLSSSSWWEDDGSDPYPCEEQALELFTALVLRTPPAFFSADPERGLETLAGLSSCADVASLILQRQDPILTNHLEALSLPADFFALRWLPRLFVGVVPSETALTILSLLLSRGWWVLPALAAFLVLRVRDDLMACEDLGMAQECVDQSSAALYNAQELIEALDHLDEAQIEAEVWREIESRQSEWDILPRLATEEDEVTPPRSTEEAAENEAHRDSAASATSSIQQTESTQLSQPHTSRRPHPHSITGFGLRAGAASGLHSLWSGIDQSFSSLAQKIDSTLTPRRSQSRRPSLDSTYSNDSSVVESGAMVPAPLAVEPNVVAEMVLASEEVSHQAPAQDLSRSDLKPHAAALPSEVSQQQKEVVSEKSQPAWGRAGVPSLDLSGLTNSKPHAAAAAASAASVEPVAVVAVSARSLSLSSDADLIGAAMGKEMAVEVAGGEEVNALTNPFNPIESHRIATITVT